MAMGMEIGRMSKSASSPGRRRAAFVLALVGGVTMLIGGVTGGLGVYSLSFAEISMVYPQLVNVLNVLLPALTAVASFGGLAVIAGGILFLAGRIGIGKLLITLGAGVGFAGIVMGLTTGLIQGQGIVASAQAVFATGQTIGWIGIFLSIFARWIARR
jgi:hypothetical protein